VWSDVVDIGYRARSPGLVFIRSLIIIQLTYYDRLDTGYDAAGLLSEDTETVPLSQLYYSILAGEVIPSTILPSQKY